MSKTTKKFDDDKQFVIGTLSRGDARLICGAAVADRLSDEDRRRLADETAEYRFDANFVRGLRQTIEDNFSKTSEGEGE